MHHPSNDVFASPTFSLNQHWNIGSRNFIQTFAHGSAWHQCTKNDVLRRNISERSGLANSLD